MVEDRKFISIEILTTEWGKVIRIKEQSHMGVDFSPIGGYTFQASNGFSLVSVCYPDIIIKPSGERISDGLYVRGSHSVMDNRPLFVPSIEWLVKLQVAVAEYNNYEPSKKPFTNKHTSGISDIETIS